MHQMYEELLRRFRLERNPFAVSPSPTIFYSTAANDEAVLQLVFGTETRQGLMVLTGEPGTGKTTILHYFRELLRQRYNYSTAYLFYTSIPSMDFLRLILRDFGIAHDIPSKGELLVALTGWLKERHRAGDCPVILIDEAQALTNAALEEVRMLLNLEFGGVKLVQIVLAGQPLLEEKLRLREMAQLRQRMMCHFQLPPFSPEQTAGYIARRLAWAGAEGSGLFPPETVQEIFKYSKGIPRVINLICEHALLASYADRSSSVDVHAVAAVAEEFELDGEMRTGGGLTRTNIFCRLLPFPEISAEDAEAKSKHGGEEAATKTEVLGEETREIASLPRRQDAVVANPRTGVFLQKPLISKLWSVASPLRSHFFTYCRAVGADFAYDCDYFVAQCREWLRTTRQPGRAPSPTRHKVVRSVRSWLLRPTGSTTLRRGPQRSG